MPYKAVSEKQTNHWPPVTLINLYIGWPVQPAVQNTKSGRSLPGGFEDQIRLDKGKLKQFKNMSLYFKKKIASIYMNDTKLFLELYWNILAKESYTTCMQIL